MNQLIAGFEAYPAGLAAAVATVVTLVAASIVIWLIRRVLRNWLDRIAPRAHLNPQTITALTRALNATLWTLALLLILGFWGVGVGGLWALLASVAAVIGVGFFATWTMVSNITAFFFVAIWRPFQLGDLIEIIPEGLRGHVVNRNLMFVELREDNGATVQIPNNLIFQRMIRVIHDGNSSAPAPTPVAKIGTAESAGGRSIDPNDYQT